MSLKDKASKIDFRSLPGVALPSSGEAAAPLPRPKTAPGLMMAQATDQRSELLRENESLKLKVQDLGTAASRAGELEEELRAWEGARATRLIDPKLITWSQWANRDEANFTGPEFLELKAEIASAGGNVQPIKVRSSKPGGDFSYELIFGHRRHRACLDLGLPVLALIDNVGELELFVEMDRENRSRKNLSAWEQGSMYLRALEKGLFPSNRKLAEKVGVDVGLVGKAISLAKLPREVIEAFPSALDIQFRWSKPLGDLHESDPDGLISRSRAAKALGPDRTAKQVFDVLSKGVGEGGRTVQPPPLLIEKDGKVAAKVEVDTKGRASVVFEPSVVSEEQLPSLKNAIETFLAKVSKAAR